MRVLYEENPQAAYEMALAGWEQAAAALTTAQATIASTNEAREQSDNAFRELQVAWANFVRKHKIQIKVRRNFPYFFPRVMHRLYFSSDQPGALHFQVRKWFFGSSSIRPPLPHLPVSRIDSAGPFS